MQKLFLTLICVTTLSFTTNAERKPLVLTTYSGYNVTGISPNGKWAVGTYVGGDDAYYAFRWNLTTNQIEVLSSNSDESEGNGISNDGIVACNFYDTQATENGAPANSGGWWNGEFHHIQSINDTYATSRNGNTRAIAVSADGTWLGGAAGNSSGINVPAVWHNGQLAWIAQENIAGRAFCVSNDGKMAAGWSTPKSAGGGWVATLWKEGEACTYLSSTTTGAPWYNCRQFSNNGKYLLYFKNFYDDETLSSGMGVNAIYQLSDGSTIGVPTMTFEPQNMELFSIADDGTVVGYEQPDQGMQQAFISINGTSSWLEDYVQTQGVALSDITDLGQSDDGVNWLYMANGISADGRVIVARYYDSNADTRSVAFILDAEYSLREPVQVQATQLTDTKSVKIEWIEPLAEAEKVVGYNIYRNGSKVNNSPISNLYYYDSVTNWGNYTYTVTAAYEEGESVESESATVNVSEKEIETPTRLYARQSRLANALVQWEKPNSNNTVKAYYTDDMDIAGFGASGQSFEGAIRFEQADLAFYQGKNLTAVTFYPLTEQNEWTLNVYEKKTNTEKLDTLVSQPITQTLSYGEKNEIKLNSPINVPSDADLYVAISVNSKSDAESNVMGIVYGLVNPEYGDLARQLTEDSLYSIYNESLSSGNPFTFTWAIGAILSDTNVSDDLDNVSQYNVYDDNTLVATTSDTKVELENLTSGTHTFALEAVYTDGRISPRTTTTLEITPNTDNYYKSIEVVDVEPAEGAAINATWEIPTDNDATLITYANESTGTAPIGPSDNAYNFQAAADYPSSLLRGLDDYKISSLRFFPLCNADFTLYLQADGEEVAQVSAESYTLNTWNDIALPSPVTIEKGKSYRLIVDIYDTEEGVAALGFDGQVPFLGQSDLYSVDEGENFASVYNSASVYGNWKIGFTAVSPNEKSLPIDHYKVYIDGKETNDGTVEQPSYYYDFVEEDAQPHSIRVDAIYNDYGTVKGGVNYFYIGQYSAIDEISFKQSDITLQNETITVSGLNVASLSLYSVDGRKQATSNLNTLNLNNITNGSYILLIKLTDGNTRSIKFCKTK